MQKYQSIISGTNGSVIRNVPVTVLKEDGSLAEIFLDREGQVPAPNPLATDSRGVFYFYAVNGRYSLRTSVDGITITDADAVLLNDPEELATAGPIAEAVAAAQAAQAAAQQAQAAVEGSGIPELVAAAQNAVVNANNAVGQAQAAASLADTAKNESAAAKVAAENAQSGAQSASTQAGQARADAQTAAQAAAQSAASIDPAYLRNRANHTGTQAISTVTGLQTALDSKVDKVAGKQLSTEDYTSAEKTKLSGIAAGATANAADAALRDRTTHTGTQPIESVYGLSVALPILIKTDPCTPCLIKTSATTLAIKAGAHVKIGNAYVSFTAQTAVTMPAVLTPGEDYCVWVKPDGTAVATADPYSSPATPPATGAVKLGGFHYGLVAPGTTPASGGFATTGFTNQGGNYPWTQSKVDLIAGINEFSIWDLTHRSKGEQRGFAFDSQQKVWIAIYFCSPDHITNGISRYNTPVASGTVLPIIPLEYGGNGTMTYGRLSAYEALEILASHGCRLMTQEEFASGALGVTEGQSLDGAASTIPATKREPGYTSRIGLEQATGHIWTIGGPLTSVAGSAWAWTAGPNRGNFYGGTGLTLFGGNRIDAANSGSRASFWSYVFWNSGWYIGLRAACDHYQGGY